MENMINEGLALGVIVGGAEDLDKQLFQEAEMGGLVKTLKQDKTETNSQ